MGIKKPVYIVNNANWSIFLSLYGLYSSCAAALTGAFGALFTAVS